MTNDSTKKLMQESLLKTSGEFTDQLMDRVEQAAAPQPMPVWLKVVLFMALAILTVTAGLLIIQLPMNVSVFSIDMELPSRPLQILAALGILFILHKFMSLKSLQANVQKATDL